MQGEANTFDYRVFVEEKGQRVSLWHDIPLEAGNGLYNFIVEIPKESAAKMEAATVRSAANNLSKLHSSYLSMSWLHGPSFAAYGLYLSGLIKTRIAQFLRIFVYGSCCKVRCSSESYAKPLLPAVQL